MDRHYCQQVDLNEVLVCHRDILTNKLIFKGTYYSTTYPRDFIILKLIVLPKMVANFVFLEHCYNPQADNKKGKSNSVQGSA